MRNIAIERASIRNKSRQSVTEDVDASAGFALLTPPSLFRRCPGLEEGALGLTGTGLFFTASMLIRAGRTNKEKVLDRGFTEKLFRNFHTPKAIRIE